MGVLNTKTLGFLSDLIAQHVYVGGSPQTMRRRWNLSGFSVSDDSANEWLDITVGEDTLTDDGDAALTIAYSAGAVTGDAIGVDINETAAPTGDSILIRARRNAVNVFRAIADASSFLTIDSPTQMALAIAEVAKLTLTATRATFTTPVVAPNDIAYRGLDSGGTERDLLRIVTANSTYIGNQDYPTAVYGSNQVDIRIGALDAIITLASEVRFNGIPIIPNYVSGQSATTGAVRMQRGDWITYGSGNRNAMTVNTSDELVLGDNSIAGIEFGHAVVQFDQALTNPVIRVQSTTTAAGTDIGVIGQTTTFSGTAGGDAYLQGGDGPSSDGQAQLRSTGGQPIIYVNSVGRPEIRHGTNVGDSIISMSHEDGSLEEYKFFPASVTTTDDTITTLFSFDVDDNKVYTYDIVVTCRSRDDGDSGGFRERGTVEGTGGSANIIENDPLLDTAQDAGWGATQAAFVLVEESANTIRVRVEGQNSDEVVWQCRAIITASREIA